MEATATLEHNPIPFDSPREKMPDPHGPAATASMAPNPDAHYAAEEGGTKDPVEGAETEFPPPMQDLAFDPEEGGTEDPHEDADCPFPGPRVG